MNRLDKFETGIVVTTVWGAAVLSAWINNPDGIRAFANWSSGLVWSVWSFILGYGAVEIINRHRQSLLKQAGPLADEPASRR
jgi:choline-glycine betaine transporter